MAHKRAGSAGRELPLGKLAAIMDKESATREKKGMDMAEQIKSEKADRNKMVADFDSNTNLTAETLSVAGANAMRALAVPADVLIESWADIAQRLAAKEAQRETMGYARITEGGSEAENWEAKAQAISAARHILALARDGGLSAKGEALGAFKAFYGALDEPSRAMVRSDMDSMQANPEWGNVLAALGAKSPQASGVILMPEAPASQEDARLAAFFAEAQSAASMSSMKTAAWRSLGSEKAGERSSEFATAAIFDMVDSIASMKAKAAEQEAKTGLSWREQGFSTRMEKSIDIQMSTMAMTLVGLTRQAGSDPTQNLLVKSGMRALCTLMSKAEALQTTDWLAGQNGGPDLDKDWKSFAASLHSTLDWGIGVAMPASASAGRPAPESLVPAGQAPRVASQAPGAVVSEAPLDVDLSEPAARPGSAFQPLPMMDMPAIRVLTDRVDMAAVESRGKLHQGSYAVGFGAGKIAKGFVDHFSPSVWARKADSNLDAFAASVESAMGAAKARVKQALARGGQALDGGVSAANEFTDRAESFVKAKSQQAAKTAAGALDGALGGAQQLASATRAGFVGKVGDLRSAAYESVGSVALKAADSMPESFKQGTASGTGPKSLAFIQVAALAGALFVGAAMAPVVGIAAAAVGAIAAGAGFASAISNAAKSLASKAVMLPGALESIGAKLGAKRAAAAADAPSIEPSMGPWPGFNLSP